MDRYGKVHDVVAIIVKYASIGAEGPTGKSFSNDIETEK
jgi:hypothetical protein